MKIEPLETGSLRIWLSEEELNKWELDGEQPMRQPTVRRLLRQVFRRLDRHIPSRLLAELIPVAGGGVLLVTPTDRPCPQNPAVYRIASADDLLDLCRQWSRQEGGAVPACCLYEHEEGYDLAVYPAEPMAPRQQHLLEEYGMLLGCGAGIAARCAEYGTLLSAGALFTAPAPPPPEPEALSY